MIAKPAHYCKKKTCPQRASQLFDIVIISKNRQKGLNICAYCAFSRDLIRQKPRKPANRLKSSKTPGSLRIKRIGPGSCPAKPRKAVDRLDSKGVDEMIGRNVNSFPEYEPVT